MKTTKAHFNIFKAECEKWIKVWWLLDWEVNYEHKKLPDDIIAQKNSNYLGKTTTLILGIDCPKSATSTYEIKKSAFHEVLELLLAEEDIVRFGDKIGWKALREEERVREDGESLAAVSHSFGMSDEYYETP